MLRAAYTHSLCILAAYEDDRLLGVVRAVGDGASIVFIQDILVFPKYQRRSIGKALLCAMMERYRTVYQMELLTDDTEKTVAFYEALGFVRVEKWGYRGLSRPAISKQSTACTIPIIRIAIT